MVVGRLQLIVLALAVAVAAAAPAGAEDLGYEYDIEAGTRILRLNREALDAIEREQYAAARKHLLEAAALAKRRGAAGTLALARTYFHLGALEIIARGDRKAAMEAFAQALELAPDLRPSIQLRGRADVNEVFHAATDVGPCLARCPPPVTGGEPDPELPAEIAGLDCRPAEDVEAGSALVVRCAAHESVEVTSLYLHYQSGAATRFKDVMMRITDRGWWKAVVPATEVAGEHVRLYVDGRNSAGRRLRSELGDARRPTAVPVRPAPPCRCPAVRGRHPIWIGR